MARLVVTKGPAAGKSHTLGKVTTIGRSAQVDLRFDDLTVSREHARIVRTESGQYVLEDLRSGNGTFVNGTRIKSHRLRDGDELTIGNSVVIFKDSDRPSTVAAADRTMLDVSGGSSTSAVINTIDVEQGVETASRVSSDTTMEQVANATRRLQILVDMFRSIGTDLNEERLLEKILDTLFRVFPDTHRGFIILRDPDTGKLVPRAARTEGGAGSNKLAISESILQYVLEKKQAVLSTDALHDGRFQSSQSIVDLQMRSVMCAPLIHENNVLGFVTLDTRKVSRLYNEEGLSLLAGIANQASLAIANARMHSRLVSQERLEQDLRNAARIQHSFLPQQPPEVPGYEFADWYTTAHEVGGDFYDFIRLPDGKWGVVVGDVSGKGITAALMMAKMTAQIRLHAAAGLSPGRLLAELNHSMLTSEPDLFVTLLILVLDSDKHTMLVSNAGHLPPMVRRDGKTVEAANCENSLPIGVIDDTEFPETLIDIGANDRVCVFTDGVTEAMNEKGELYGFDRLKAAILSAPDTPRGILESIQKSVWAHIGTARQSDDLSLVCFGRLNGGQSGA
jgi:sigma-B regulation protein RsbU (phosphoserine phosphatase)